MAVFPQVSPGSCFLEAGGGSGTLSSTWKLPSPPVRSAIPGPKLLPLGYTLAGDLEAVDRCAWLPLVDLPSYGAIGRRCTGGRGSLGDRVST